MRLFAVLAVLFVSVALGLGQSTPSQYPYPKPFGTAGATPAGGGVKRSAPFQPAAYDQDAPIAWDVTIGGGFRVVGTIAERNAINAQWRKEGMVVRVTANGKEYVLGPDLVSWTEVPVGTTGQYQSNGVIANDTFDTAMTGWSAYGGASWTVSAGRLIVSGGGDPVFFTDRIERDIITASERWQMEADLFAPNPLPTLGAVLFGVKSIVDTYPRDSWGVFGLGTDPSYGPGKLSIFQTTTVSTGTQLSASTFNLPLAGGDQVRFRVRRQRNIITVAARNITQNSGWNSISATLTDGSSEVMHTTGHFSICTSGGDWQLDNLKITDDMPRYPDVIVMGDSISYGFQGGVSGDGTSLRFGDWLQRQLGGKMSVLAGSGDRTADLIQRLGEVTNKTPQTVIIFAGTNDAATGVATATTQTNLITLRNACAATGAKVVMVTPLPRSGVTTLTLRDWMMNTTGWPQVADPYPSFAVTGAGGYRTDLLPDGIHPNNVGHKIISHHILTALDQ